MHLGESCILYKKCSCAITWFFPFPYNTELRLRTKTDCVPKPTVYQNRNKNIRVQMPTNMNLSTLNARVQKIDPEYIGVTTAWNDGQRGVSSTGFSMLSSLGNNITDARLIAQDGGVLPFVRPHNLDERLGITTADKIFFVEKDGTQTTAQEVLEKMNERASYMGYSYVDAKMEPKEKVVVRVQNVWVPLHTDEKERNVAPGHYSYQTHDAADPRNLIVLGTPSGVFVHSDAAGIKKLMAHSSNPDGSVNEHWHTVKPTDKRVGEVQEEDESQGIPEKRACTMGLQGIEFGANCFFIMSIPNTQTILPDTDDEWGKQCVYRSLGNEMDGVSRAAHVSVDYVVSGIAAKNAISIVRPGKGVGKEPIVITIMIYHTVQADAAVVNVAEEDLVRAINEIKSIYKTCDQTCKLSELPTMLHKLTAQDVQICTEKVVQDPVFSDPFSPQADALDKCY